MVCGEEICLDEVGVEGGSDAVATFAVGANQDGKEESHEDGENAAGEGKHDQLRTVRCVGALIREKKSKQSKMKRLGGMG